MKPLIYSFNIIILNIALVFALDNNNEKSIPVDSIVTVNINLNGNIFLENSSDDRLHLRTTTKIEGKVIGISNRDNISPYIVDIKKEDKILNISPHPREKSWTIGVSTISEENTHFIHIPKNMNVIVNSNNAKIMVNGLFSLLKVENTKGETAIQLSKSKIHYLKANTKNGRLWINDMAVKNNYNLISSGYSVIDISSKSGLIKLGLN